jgi:hypothetical protein
MALAVLSKGLMGFVLPGVVLLVYCLCARDWQRLRQMHCVQGGILFLLICLPWFIWVSVENPEFPEFFFIREHLQRFSSKIHDRTEPAYYFIVLLSLGFAPWLFQLFAGCCSSWEEAPQANGFRPGRLILVWVGLILVFFSLSQSKLPGYILPIFPGLALLAAQALTRISQVHWQGQLAFFFLLTLLGLSAYDRVSSMGPDPAKQMQFAAYAGWGMIVLGFALVGLIGAWYLAYRHMRLSIVAYATTFFLGAHALGLGHEIFGRSASGIDLARKITPWLRDKDRFYSLHMLDHTLPFYLGHTMTMVEIKDELAFGTAQEPEKFVPTLASFIEQWRGLDRAFAIMPPYLYAELEKAGLPMYVIGRDQRRVAVAKHPINAAIARRPQTDDQN